MIRHIADLLVGAILICGMAFLFGMPPVKAAECGKASWYGVAHHGRTMANGRPFNMHAMTAASWSYPLGTVVKVRSQATGKEIKVTITDRGPARRLGRVIDLSRAAFAKLAPLSKGLTKVCVTRLR